MKVQRSVGTFSFEVMFKAGSGQAEDDRMWNHRIRMMCVIGDI